MLGVLHDFEPRRHAVESLAASLAVLLTFLSIPVALAQPLVIWEGSG